LAEQYCDIVLSRLDLTLQHGQLRPQRLEFPDRQLQVELIGDAAIVTGLLEIARLLGARDVLAQDVEP
jgi:hypothetical protein